MSYTPKAFTPRPAAIGTHLCPKSPMWRRSADRRCPKDGEADGLREFTQPDASCRRHCADGLMNGRRRPIVELLRSIRRLGDDAFAHRFFVVCHGRAEKEGAVLGHFA